MLAEMAGGPCSCPRLITIRRKFGSPNSAFILSTLRIKGMHGGTPLARIQLDDELLVDDGLHLFARWDVHNFAAERIAIDGEPIGHGDDLC